MIRAVSFLFVICFHITLSAQSIHEQLTQQLDSISRHSSIVGFGAAIYTKDTLLYSRGFGLASVEGQDHYTPHIRQKIASISKLLLGISLAKAQELDLLDLDDDVNDYLPFDLSNPYFPELRITIRHLASHTAGLAQLPDYDQKALFFKTKIPPIQKEMPFGIKKWMFNRIIKQLNANEEIDLEEFLTNLYTTDGKWYSKKHFLKKAPGTEEEYSNTGASLLALVIGKASGMSYADFVQRYISEPVGMTNSAFDFERTTPKENLAQYYHDGIRIKDDYRLLLYPAGGFESSIDDFYRLMQVIAKDREGCNYLLTKESTTEMLQAQFDTEHGILWEVYDDGEIGHRGDIIGATSFAYYDTSQDRGYLLFLNTGGTSTLDDETYELRQLLKKYAKTLTDHE